MAELLIMARDTSNAESAKDVFAYKLGHVIAVMPDGHKWGKEECLPKFYLVKLPKVKVEDVRKYLNPKVNILSAKRPTIAIRQYKLDVMTLPIATKNVLEKDGVITVEKATDFDGYMTYG